MSTSETLNSAFDETLVNQFKIEVSDQATDIDETDEQDWYSLTLGWAIAKGLDAESAHSFAQHIRYNTDLG